MASSGESANDIAASKPEQATRNAAAGLWIPIAGFLYALFCPVSEKYFQPFRHLLPWDFDGRFARFLTPNGFFAGTLFLRLLFLIPLVLAFAVSLRGPHHRVLRWRAISAGMYWPLLISTIIAVANSGYALLWSWILLPVHVFVAIIACVVVNKLGPSQGRWVWLGTLSGLAFWILASLL